MRQCAGCPRQELFPSRSTGLSSNHRCLRSHEGLTSLIFSGISHGQFYSGQSLYAENSRGQRARKRLGFGSSRPTIPAMKPTDLQNRDDLAILGRINFPFGVPFMAPTRNFTSLKPTISGQNSNTTCVLQHNNQHRILSANRINRNGRIRNSRDSPQTHGEE